MIASGTGDRVAIEDTMKTRGLTIPEIMLIGGTRVALGAGVGLLLSGRLNKEQRKAAGWALFAVGALSSIPIVLAILGKPAASEEPVGLAA
jgi:hypothetical protein